MRDLTPYQKTFQKKMNKLLEDFDKLKKFSLSRDYTAEDVKEIDIAFKNAATKLSKTLASNLEKNEEFTFSNDSSGSDVTAKKVNKLLEEIEKIKKQSLSYDYSLEDVKQMESALKGASSKFTKSLLSNLDEIEEFSFQSDDNESVQTTQTENISVSDAPEESSSDTNSTENTDSSNI